MPEKKASNLHQSDSDLKRLLDDAHNPIDVRSESHKYASALWKLLVRNVGEPDARSILRHVMGEKKPGRPTTDRDVALSMFFYAYIRHWGLKETVGKIATRIYQSSPYYLKYKSGAVAVANSEFTEEYMSLVDDPIVDRERIDMKIPAIKKRLDRMRRFALEENILPSEYAPRPYYRDL